MANPFSDPFTNPDLDASVFGNPLPPATPRGQAPVTGLLDDPLSQLEYPDPALASGVSTDPEDDEEAMAKMPPMPGMASPDLLSAPMNPEKGPTSFQQKKVNWADGGEDLSRPRFRDVGAQDWLEVDYLFGKKEGASGKPVEAANVFGRQFTADELLQDDEGRKLLDLMNLRRSGTFNEGGTMANFVKGWGNWSKSDIPFYGWMTDIGTSATEAVEMSRTIKKLQNGEAVSNHEALAVRRFMLQQELESTRTMAYNVGSVVRQAVPFMAEMAASSAIGAAVGSVVPGIGTAIGGAGGAIVGGLKWLFTGGKIATKAATRTLVSQGTKALAKKLASGAAVSAVERRTLRTAATDLFGSGIIKTVRTEAMNELGAGASRKAIYDLAAKKLATRISEANVLPSASRSAVNRLVEADVANAVSSGAQEALRKYALQFAKAQPAKNASAREIDRLVREGLAAALARKDGAKLVQKELKDLGESFVKGLVKEIGGERGTLTAMESIGQSMLKVTGAESIENRFLESITKTIINDSIRNFELRYGKRGFVNGAERFLRYAQSNVMRGFMQSEHAFIRGGAPTIAHGGFGTFNRAWDAVAEGIGRTMIQAPIQAGIQLGVQTPLYLGAKAVNGDVVVRGQLGEQVNALMTGDRDRMDHAHFVAIGQMFAEYWSENTGRGLASLVGGVAAGVARKTPAELIKSISGARDTFITPLSRATGDTLSKAVEAIFGFKDIKKMSLQRVANLAERYVRDTAIKGATKADLVRIAQTKSLDGISDAFRASLKTKGIEDASTFIKRSIGHMEDMTRGRAGRAFIGYYLMQKGLTPDRIVRAFRQMGKGGGIIEEMGEERFGDFIKGLMGVDDSASNADLLSEERLKNMFGGWMDGEQLATEFLGFAFPGIARNTTIRLQSWMGQGAMRQAVNDGMTITRITDAAKTAQKPVLQVEETEATGDEIAASVVRTVPFAGPNMSATAEEEQNARGKVPDIQLVGADAREELSDALDGFATRLGRANVELEPTMSWGRRALTRIAGLPAALATGDFSFMAANPAAWAAADTGVPLQMQEAALNAYNQSLIHGYRQIEGEFTDELRKRFNEAIAKRGNFSASLRDMNLDTATLRKIEEAGAEFRRETLLSVAQEYLSASGVLYIAQSDLTAPAQKLVDSGKAVDIEDAKKQIIDGAVRIVQDQNAAFYASHGKPGRAGYTMSIDTMRAVQNGTSNEVLSAILQLPAFRGVAGVVNVSDNAEHSMSAIEALGRTVDASRIAAITPGADGRLSETDLAEVMKSMGRRADMYDEETNQKAAISWIGQVKLMLEGSMCTFSDNNPDTDRTATVLPVMDGATRSWVVRVTGEDGMVTTSAFTDYKTAVDFVEAQGFTADHKEIVITNTREVVSNDATSMVYFMYGNERETLRRAYLRELGDQRAVDRDVAGLRPEGINEDQLPPYLRRNFTEQADGSIKAEWQYATAEEAAAQFRMEKGDETSPFQAYERTGSVILDSLGVTRQATPGTEAMGTGADMWVARVDGGFNRNALIIAPDFMSNGDSEAMLRSAIKLALNTSVASMDADNAGRRQLLSKIYTEFTAARDRVLAQLKREDSDKHDQLKRVMDRVFPVRTGAVSTDALSAIITSSVFFSAERGLRQEGNGFFGSPELAAVADEFRASEAYPLLLSAVDEILGGNGFFTRQASSVNGLARYLQAFGVDPRVLADARNAAIFNPENSKSKANPYLVRYSYKDGKLSIDRDADGDTVRAEKFDGDLAAGYIKSIADNCHVIANQFADEDGKPADGGYTTAEMYRRMKQAGMFAGDTASTAEMPAPMVEIRSGDIVTTEAGRRALDAGAKLRESPTMSVDDAKHLGLSLRAAFRAAGYGLTDGLQSAVRYLRDRGVPEENVQQIINAYAMTEVSNEEVGATESELDRRQDELASDDTAGTDKFDHESNIKQFDSNADVRAVSNVVKWFFNLEGGDVSALFVRLHDTLRNIPTGTLDSKDAKAVEELAVLMNPFAEPEKARENLAKAKLLRFGDREEVSSLLDSAISALVRNGMFAHAVAISAIRELPHNRRLKVLQLMSQLSPVGAMEIRRKGDGPFTLWHRTNPRDNSRAISAFQTMYTSLLSTPLFAKGQSTDWAETAEDFGERIALIETVVQSVKNPETMRLRMKNEILNKLGFNYDDFISAIEAAQKIGPSEDKFVKNGNFNIFAINKADFDVLATLDRSGNPILNSAVKPRQLAKALNNIQALTVKRMEALARATDILLGTGSDASAMLRMHDSYALLRRRLERAIVEGQRSAQRYLVEFLDFTNEFAAVQSAGFKSSNAGARTLRPCSRFLYETVYEPISGLARRLTGDSADTAMRSEAAGRYADDLVKKGWAKDAEAGRAAYARDAHMMRGVNSHKDRVARYSEALKGKDCAAVIRSMLANMAQEKYLTSQNLADGVSAVDARRAFSSQYDFTARRTPDNMPLAIRLHMAAMPTNSARMGARPKNAIEGAENRTITTLPSQVPAFLRACNSPLFHFEGLEELKANGLRWADGSNPVVAILGCDDNGNLVDRMHLAGIANTTIINQMARIGTTDSIVVPLFRGDKSSMYALQVPAAVAVRWVKAVADGSAGIEVNEAVRERIVQLMSKVKNLDSLLTFEVKNKNLSLTDILAKGKDFEKMSQDEKTMYLRAEFYSSVYGLMAQACGQDSFDPKRVAVNLSIGPIIPMDNYTGVDREGEPKTGYYRTTIVGGVSGSAMMGGWFMHGSAADAIAAMSDDGSAQAIKVHVYELQDPDDIEFDKGQAHDYGLGIEDDEEDTNMACVKWWQAQMRKRVCLALGLKPDALERPEEPEILDPNSLDGLSKRAKYDEDFRKFDAARRMAREFCKNSTFGVDDMETHKAGAFGSRCGLFVEDSAREIRLGKDVLFVRDGKDWKVSDAVASKFPALKDFAIEVKSNAAPLMGVLAAYAALNGDTEWEKLQMIEPTWVDDKGETHEGQWRRADGSVATGAFGKAGILSKTATLGVRLVDGAVAVDYFSRSMIAQSVANNSSPSTVKNGHSFATNLTRDVQVDELLIQAVSGVAEDLRKTSFVDAHTAYAMLQLGQLVTNTDLLWEAVAADEELAAQVKRFRNDREVRDVVYEKIKAYVAKQIIPSYHGNHGVMVASGIKASCDRFNHRADFEYAPGMDDYTKDCYRPARVYTTALKKAFGMSRSYASGCVNVKQPGFRYGLYMVEDKFDAFASKYLAEQMKGTTAAADIERFTAAGYSADDARRMVAVRFAIEGWKDGTLDRDARNDLFDNCFTSYSGRPSAWEAFYGNVRFDDLFLDDGSFDYAALECGDMARTGTDGKKHFYIGGSFFAAHRSPSGNIEAFCGLVRAVAPITFNRETLEPGKESKYALDPVTTNTQGSDTDGDSSGIQVYDYSLPSNDSVTAEALRDFTSVIASETMAFSAKAKRIMELADKWTVMDEKGRKVIDPNVLLLIERMLFKAQIDNYRNSPTFHQGYVGTEIADAKRGKAADIIDGADIADITDGWAYDTGYAGRAPVGTDAVWEEPITKEVYDGLPKDVLASAPAWKAGMTWQDVFNKTIGGAKLDLIDPFSAANLSNAASDSADARGVSVFLQSRYLRALSEGINVEQGNFRGTRLNTNRAIDTVRDDGYSPIIDLTSHFDNISNNLFDTLKKMFATRAGWTKDLLKVVMSRIVRHAAEQAIRNPNLRLDNRFFTIELIRFFNEKNQEGDPITHAGESPIHRFLRYNEPMNGRKALVDDLMAVVSKYPAGTTGTRVQAALAQVLDRKNGPSMTVTDIAFTIANANGGSGRVRIQDSLTWLVGHFGDMVERRTPTKEEIAFMNDVLNSTGAIIEAAGDITDFPKLVGRPFAKLPKLVRQFDRKLDLSMASDKQATVSRMFAGFMNSGTENVEVIVDRIGADLRARQYYNPEFDVPSASQTLANYERLCHLYGAFGALEDLTGDAAGWISKCGNTTAEFVENVAKAVRYYSNRELANANGVRGEKGIDLIRTLFMSLSANDAVIHFSNRASSRNLDLVRKGYGALKGSNLTFEVNGQKIPGKIFARILVVHASCTSAYSALSDYASQSTLPAVFGDSDVAEMDSYRYVVEQSYASPLYWYPPISVGEEGSYTVSNIYDISRNLGQLTKIWKEHHDPVVNDAFTNRFLPSMRNEVRVENWVPGTEIEKSDLPINVTSDSVLCRPYTVAHRLSEFAFPTMNADGSIDTDTMFRSVEDALNEWMTRMVDRVTGSFDHEEAKRFFAATGKFWFETGVSGREQSLFRAARSIVGYAVRRSPQLFGMLEDAGDSVIRISDVRSPLNEAVEAAFASAQRQIASGKVQMPSLPPPSVSVDKGGDSAKIDPTTVIRANFLKCVEQLYPDFEEVTAAQMKKSVPDAIEAAFKRIFGDTVKVTKVLNDAGEQTNLLRVERKIGDKTIVTHIAYGESIAKGYAERVNDRRTIESIVNAINAKSADAHLNADEILALPENERRMFLGLVGEHSVIAGQAASVGTKQDYYPTNFSGAMSGLIRLNLNAGFQTLFHEYFHSMLACYRHLGISTAEDEKALAEAFHGADGKFNEEAAANAYSQYLTRLDAANGNDVRLRDYYKDDGTVNEKVLDIFDKFRTRALLLSEAFFRGFEPTGLPVFIRCTFIGDLTGDQLSKVTTPDPAQVEQIESLILSKSGADAEDLGIPMNHTLGQDIALDEAWKSVLSGGAAGSMSTVMQKLIKAMNEPVRTEGPEVTTDPEPARTRPVDPLAGMSPVGKVSSFLKAAMERFGLFSHYNGIDEDLAELKKAEANADAIGTSIGAQRVVFGARRLIRETASALGIEIEKVVDGRIVLTADGEELLKNGTVGELALLLMHASGEERKLENAKYELGAKEASADFTFGRALQVIAPESYYNYAMKLATRSRDLFAAAERRALDAAEAAKVAGDTAKEVKYRKMASELGAQATRVIEYTRLVASGSDAHFIFPKNKNSGNLHGLLFKVFSGGAKFADVGSLDGIRRYDADGQFDFSFDLSDPTIQLAYDLANQAFFTSEAARKFDGKGYHSERFDELRDSVIAVNTAAPSKDDGLPPIPETVDFDMGMNAPHWILSNPGSWLASDMQKDFGAVSLRDMMTDHSVKAATESAYNLATTALQFFGCDCYAGDKLRFMEQVKSDLVKNENGDMAYAEGQGADILRFSHTSGYLFGAINFGAKRVGKEMTSEDLQLVNIALQAVRGMVGGDKALVTDIGLGFLASEVYNLTKRDVADFYSPERVMYRVRHGYEEEGDKRILASHLDKALARLLLALPRQILGEGNVSVRDNQGIVTFSNRMGPTGLYTQIVRVLKDAASNAARERSDADRTKIMEKALLDSGLAVKGKKGINLALPMAHVEDAWQASKNGGAMGKLIEAGRPEKMLDLAYWADEFARETTKLNKAAAKSSYLRGGSGSNLTLAASPNFWFHGGSGAHMLDVQRYRTAIEMLRDMKPSKTEDIERNHRGLFDTFVALEGRLDAPAFKDGAALVSDSQMLYLADLCGIDTSAGSGFTLSGFIEDIVRGDYAGGQRVPGVDIDANSTKFDLALAINRLVNDKIVTDANATALTKERRQELADIRSLNERIADRLANSVPGRILAKSDLQVFQQTGEVGTSWTAAESLLQMTKEIVAAERYRGCMAQMLTSVAADGTPNYIVDPSEFADNVDRMPDEYWGALARFAIQRWNGKGNMVSYDESISGIDNMKAVFKAYSELAKDKYRPMTEKDAKIRPLFNGMLCRKTDVDNAGNVNDLTLTQGGEAMAYMKQLLGAVHSADPGTFMKQAERLMAWTKLASVGFSSFFQIATAFESQAAASGFTQAFLGNLPGRSGAKLGRAIGRALGRKGGLGALQEDALSFKDIIENINSNDPFMVQARELCDLIGMPLDQSVDPYLSQNESNPGLGQGSLVKQDIENVYRVARRFGVKKAGMLKSFLYFAYQHPTDYTFNVVLNGVKLAVVAQTMRRLREECLQGERPFDPIAELRKHSAYMNAEIGGIDPARYAWATPQMQRILRMGMFSWQWTVGAWVAGSGEMISDAIFGGHSTTRASRQYAFIRWMRMLGIVKFGVPLVLQLSIKLLAKAVGCMLPPPDDPEEEDDFADERKVPWMMWNNESKAGSLSFDITPLLKIAARVPGVKALKEADIPMISALIPAYIGGGRNTTGKRRYYMHFGKQSDEFFRWFTDPVSQMVSKTSIPGQKILEGLFGKVSPNGYAKPFAELDFFERWFNTNLTADNNAFVNLGQMFLPFSWQGAKANADAGFLAAVGPMKMGQSKRSTRLRIVERMNDFIEDARTNDPWSYRRNRRKLNLMCTDILREAQLNGVDPAEIVTSALGDVAHVHYLRLMDALPKEADSANVDAKKAMEAIRALTRINRKMQDIKNSVVQKYKAAGTDAKKNPFFYSAMKDLIRTTQQAPFADDEAMRMRFERWFGTTTDDYVRSTQMAAKGGEVFGNFLATDEVPETLFGVPIIARREDYTEASIEFFKEHPEAGGYYDMGDGEGEPPEGLELTPSEEPLRPSGTSGDLKGGKYDTAVPKGREAEYRAWKAKYAPDDSGEDYDLQGAFMEGLAPDPRTGHWPDKYKKPNHPTFSVESKYAVGADANLAGTWDGETYVPNPNAVSELWNRAVKSTGNLDGMARVFAAMSGESSLNQRGATDEQISNGHLARLIIHANETDRYNKNPANYHKRTVMDTTNRTSHVLSKYKWGTGPGANWFDSSKMEPRFDLINSDPVASKTARSLIMNVARFLNGDLKGKDWLPSDAISYGDGPKGLMSDREDIKPEENRIGPMPHGFRIGRKKGAK